MEITIKTSNEKEFQDVMNFLKKENITIIKSVYKNNGSDKFEDYKVMEEFVDKNRYKLPENFKFDREDANNW